MKYDVVTSHMYTQHWIVEAESKDKAEELFKKASIVWSKELRKYVVRYVTPDVAEGLITSPDAELRAIMPVPGQNKPTFTKLNE
jgi:hypothetical protein